MIYWIHEYTLKYAIIIVASGNIDKGFGFIIKSKQQLKKETNKQTKKKQQMLHSDRFLKLTKISTWNPRKLGVRGGNYLVSQFSIKNWS